jgi:GTPase KRas protein
MVVDNRPCILEIMDTAGRGKYAAIRESHIYEGEAFIIAYSVTSRESFSHVRAYYNQIKEVKQDMSIKDTLQQSPSQRPCRPPIVLVGTKNDLQAQREVSAKEGRMLAKSLDCWFYETSAKYDADVEKTFHDVIRCFREHNLPSSLIPASKRSKGSTGRFWGTERRKVYNACRCIVM